MDWTLDNEPTATAIKQIAVLVGLAHCERVKTEIAYSRSVPILKGGMGKKKAVTWKMQNSHEGGIRESAV